MIWDGDDNQNDSLSDDGKGSDDEEIADDVHQLLGQTAPAQRESDDSDIRNSNSGDQRGRGGLHACGVRPGRRGRGRTKSQVGGCGCGAYFSVCMRCWCLDTLVNTV